MSDNLVCLQGILPCPPLVSPIKLSWATGLGKTPQSQCWSEQTILGKLDDWSNPAHQMLKEDSGQAVHRKSDTGLPTQCSLAEMALWTQLISQLGVPGIEPRQVSCRARRWSPSGSQWVPDVDLSPGNQLQHPKQRIHLSSLLYLSPCAIYSLWLSGMFL